MVYAYTATSKVCHVGQSHRFRLPEPLYDASAALMSVLSALSVGRRIAGGMLREMVITLLLSRFLSLATILAGYLHFPVRETCHGREALIFALFSLGEKGLGHLADVW